MKKDETIEETTVTISYSEYNSEISYIKEMLAASSGWLIGNDHDRQYSIHYQNIFYIESLERKTFIYTKKNVYSSTLRLYEMEEKLPQMYFVRISKSCILNINALKSIAVLPNSRLEATLKNDEKILVNRTYLSNIKNALKGGFSSND